MRYTLLLLFIITGFSASAQIFFWKKKHTFKPGLPIKACALGKAAINSNLLLTNDSVKPYIYDESEFSLLSRERALIKDARHNMSWHIYNAASYNFSDLAQLYIRMHRYSEAKWYFLQSISLSRQENDSKHTVAILVSLAAIKENLGDLVSARADLNEAHDLAQVKGMKEKAEEINKMIPLLGQNKLLFVNHYAASVADGNKDL